MDNPAPIVVSPGAPRLHDMAFNAFYKVLCKATPSTVKFMREYMENQGEIIREKCIQKFNDLMPNSSDFIFVQKLTVTDINVCAFLDSILDVTFLNKLEINIPYQHQFESYSQLFSIIAQRCPKLKSLKITFYSNIIEKVLPITFFSGFKTSMHEIGSRLQHSNITQVTHRLNRLEALDLSHTHVRFSHCSTENDETHLRNCDSSILAIVAEYCPALVNLTVRGFYIRDRDVLGLITGASAKTLFLTPTNQWAIDFNRIHTLVVPGELMSPLCFTLRSLQFTRSWPYYHDCDADISDTTAAFALKHLPVLKTSTFSLFSSFDSSTSIPCIRVIELLYSDRGDDSGKSEHQTAFEEHCRLLTNITRHPNQPSPTGFLGLSEVKGEEVRFPPYSLPWLNADRLRAIGYMCPHLDRFEFDEEMLRDEEMMRNEEAPLAPGELESILSAWPKLSRISLMNFKSLSSSRTIFGAFSVSLTDLSLWNCSPISLTSLSLCTQLLQLRITNSVLYSDTSLDVDKFLPSLKYFHCNVCLGDFAHLFERKSTLIEAEFNCCHIGTNAYNDPAMEWSQVPKLWPHLQSLRIGRATGLTMDIVSKLVSEMPAIMLIELPRSVTLEAADQLDLTRKITQDGCKRKHRLVIGHFGPGLSPCIYQCT